MLQPATSVRPWLWPNLLSLDAPIVAVLWQTLFSRCFHAGVNTLAAILLVLSVWLIYSLDRVFDAWKKAGGMPRHLFYGRHWRMVLPLWTLTLTIAGWLAWTRLPEPILQRGCILLAAVGLYFAVAHSLRIAWPKEAVVAVLFALGASLSAWGHVHSTADVATIVLFSSLCWINCAAIEQWENRTDGWPVTAAALCVAALAIVILAHDRPVLSAAETASALAFVLLDRGRKHLSRDALRVLADVALLSPLFFLPIAGTLA
jgi:hypothetical protein